MVAKRPGSSIELRVLGGFRLSRCGHAVTLRLGVQRIPALLAVHGRVDRRDLAGKLWPELTQDRALSNLRTILWRLRSVVPGLVSDGMGTCELSEGVHVDLMDVQQWGERSMAGSSDPQMPPGPIGLMLLPGWDESWLTEPREALRLTVLHSLEAACLRFLFSGRLAEASLCARKAVTVDPLRESAHRLLLEVHLRQGNQAEAIRHFAKYRTALREEVGVAPGVTMLAMMAPLMTPEADARNTTQTHI